METPVQVCTSQEHSPVHLGSKFNLTIFSEQTRFPYFSSCPSCLLHCLSSWQVWSTGCSLYSCPVITHRMEALPLSEVLLILGTQISYSWLTYQRPILREVKIEKSYMIAVFPGMNVILREKYQCQSPNKFLPRRERRPGSREFRSSSQSNRLHCNRVAECLPSMHRT